MPSCHRQLIRFIAHLQAPGRRARIGARLPLYQVADAYRAMDERRAINQVYTTV